MEILKLGNEITVPGGITDAEITVTINPATEVVYDVTGSAKNRLLHDTIYLRGFTDAVSLALRAPESSPNRGVDGTPRFARDTVIRLKVRLAKSRELVHSFDIDPFKAGDVSEFPALSFTPSDQGLVVAAGDIEIVDEAEHRVYDEIAEGLAEQRAAAPATPRDQTVATPRSLVILVDQSSSMCQAVTPERLRNAAKFLAGVFVYMDLEVSVVGTSQTSSVQPVKTITAAEDAIQALTPLNEVGWGRGIDELTDAFDRVVVLSDTLPEHMQSPEVLLVRFGVIPDRFWGIDFDAALENAVVKEDHAFLKSAAEYCTEYITATANNG